MSFTRFHDDPCRVEKQLQESTGPGRYMLDVPGNGSKPCYMEDPCIRLQQWGANLQTNPVGLESELFGITRPLAGRDCGPIYKSNSNNVNSQRVQYPSCSPFIEQPRATNPAWTARDLEQVNWWTLPLNPQENVCLPFHNNISTRILERDYFVACAPKVLDNPDGTISSSIGNSSYAAPTTPSCVARNSCQELS